MITMNFRLSALLLGSSLFMAACNNAPAVNATAATADSSKVAEIKDETVSYPAGDLTMKSYVAYDGRTDAKRPAVLVIPEWWGLTDYARGRAKQLAALGYIAMAVDFYGDGKTADNPDSAGKWAGVFYKEPMLAKSHFDAAVAKIKSYPQTDTSKIAAIGYCFGGAMVLNMARLGEDLKGVVSFHGNLVGVPAKKDVIKAKILVCQGEDDQFVKPAERAEFKKQLDSIGYAYTFISYPGANHAFTNPKATELGQKFKLPIAYNAAADSASWKAMREFFGKIF